MHLEREDAEHLSLANLNDRPSHRIVLELARHIRRGVELNLAQRRPRIDVAGLEP